MTCNEVTPNYYDKAACLRDSGFVQQTHAVGLSVGADIPYSPERTLNILSSGAIYGQKQTLRNFFKLACERENSPA
jgi:hypothetical protein